MPPFVGTKLGKWATDGCNALWDDCRAMPTHVLLGRLHGSIQVNQVFAAAWASATDKIMSALLCCENGLYHMTSGQAHVSKSLLDMFCLFGMKKHLIEGCPGP